MTLQSNPGHISGENTIWKDTCTPVFIAALFTTAKLWKQPKCPSTEDGQRCGLKKKWNYVPLTATQMDLEDVTEWSKSDREREIPYDIPNMWNLKEMIQMNFCTKLSQTRRLREQTYDARGKGVGKV